MSRPFVARYGGTCDDCGERIRPGEQVTYDGEDLIHVDCEEASDHEPLVAVCPRCWLTRPCGCDEEAIA